MSKHVILVTLAAAFLAGCTQAELGTERALGPVQYADAFRAARTVTAQYFTVASADRSSGVIKSAPKTVAPDMALGSAERQLATITVRQRGSVMTAYAMVEIQRQGVAMKRHVGFAEVYDGPPSHTPAEREAATTPEQNEYWITRRRDRALENKILTDIYRALHGEGGTE